MIFDRFLSHAPRHTQATPEQRSHHVTAVRTYIKRFSSLSSKKNKKESSVLYVPHDTLHNTTHNTTHLTSLARTRSPRLMVASVGRSHPDCPPLNPSKALSSTKTLFSCCVQFTKRSVHQMSRSVEATNRENARGSGQVEAVQMKPIISYQARVSVVHTYVRRCLVIRYGSHRASSEGRLKAVVYAGFLPRFPFFIQRLFIYFLVLGVRVRVSVRVTGPPTLSPIES